MITLTQLLCALAALVIVFGSVGSLGCMTMHTSHLIRVAQLMVSIGSFAELAHIAAGRDPGIFETLMMVGMATLCTVDRRCTVTKPGGNQHV